MLASATGPLGHWADPCTHSECTLHQLSPYIGKLKSSIARDLIERFSQVGDIVADPFAGSGTVPLEAAISGRNAIAFDVSSYATTLCRGKLDSPKDLTSALQQAERLLAEADRRSNTDLRRVPKWVRDFFHPRTLKEAIRFSEAAIAANNHFLLSCFLGILHHQRPGFLSFPSSHLVPYLRTKRFPRDRYPELYDYRPLRPRLLAKIERAFKRPPVSPVSDSSFSCERKSIQEADFPDGFDCLITSPPYMNALDYGRDNRLRLWFLGDRDSHFMDQRAAGKDRFRASISALARKLEDRQKRGG